jgi:diguanylate cyclase (GGDEF)-like protein/PAS domain S-box-containing protein
MIWLTMAAFRKRVLSKFQNDFRSLFESHPSPMWVYDPISLRFLIVNKAAMELYGYSRAQYETLTVLDIRPHYERHRMLEAIEKRSDIDKAERWEHLKSNGEVIQVQTYGREVLLEGERAILAIVQDRSELSAAQNEIVATRALLDSIVDNLPVGVFVKDMADDGRYIRFNEACGAITGLLPDSVIGKSDAMLMPERLAADVRLQDDRAFSTAQITYVEEKVARPDRTVRTVHTVRRVLPAPDGMPPRYLIGICRDVTEKREFDAKLERLAMHDVLTGLPNRASFMEHIRRRLSDSANPAPFALIWVDVDHFKNINDSIGHPAGDALLCGIARCLTDIKAKGDFVARLGGDEFAVLVDIDGHADRPRRFAEALFDMLQKPFDLDGAKEYVGCSLGIALAPVNGDSVDVLMRSADLALYAAKDAGRSTFRFYADEMRITAEHRHQIATELREAIIRRELELFYQPIAAAESGDITGFEALVRWRHPVRGLIPPADFIPAAEENGLIFMLGEWVLREACATAASWPKHLRIAVNFSVCQFRDTGLLNVLVSALSESGLAPDRLEIEVTESVFLADNIQGVPLLTAMKQLGVRIAIDDFGTGYSSLSYLRSFPFDKIKLDKRFVSGIETDAGDLAIVRAVAGIARGFGATALAEGVETEGQLRCLRAEGFDEVQGYLLGRPMPRREADALVRPIERLEAAR